MGMLNVPTSWKRAMRTKMRYALLVAAVVACSTNGVAPRGSLKSAMLRYNAASTQGVPLLAGSLSLTIHEDSTVTGTWEIDWVAGADTTARVGPQVGSGAFSGQQFADGSVQLNLNPLYADNNVFLSATVTRDGFSGAWSWSGIAGPIAAGRFTAAYAASP